MKFIVLSACVAFSLFNKLYNEKVIEIENEMYQLYSDNFSGYLIFDENYNMKIDKEKIKKHLGYKGYNVEFFDYNNCLGIVVGTGKIKRQFSFYVEKNYENK